MVNMEKSMIQNFIKENTLVDAQRSEEWFKLRQSNVGGSEMAVILGLKPFGKDIRTLIYEKLNPVRLNTFPIRWGTLMEDAAVYEINKIFEKKVIEVGCLKGRYPNMTYSPDGILEINKSELLKIIDQDLFDFRVSNNTLEDKENYIVLVEIKCPVSRKINGQVPNYYLPQILSGLSHFPIFDFALFFDCSFEECSFGDICISFPDCNDENISFKDAIMENNGKFENIEECVKFRFKRKIIEIVPVFRVPEYVDKLYPIVKFMIENMNDSYAVEEYQKKYLDELKKTHVCIVNNYDLCI